LRREIKNTNRISSSSVAARRLYTDDMRDCSFAFVSTPMIMN